jgi:hypothetical protein
LSTPRPPDAAGPWTLLFPLTYAVHVAEECWGGETFYGWVSRVASVDLSRDEFLALNTVAMLVMIGGVLVANLTPVRLPIAALATVTALNGTLHVLGSVATASYSPGVISGVGLWIPLGAYALRRTRRTLSRAEFYGGVAAGLAAHGLVSVVAFTS